MEKEHKAERARALLNDDLFSEAIEEIRQDATKALTGCDPKDTDKLQYAALQLRAVEQVVGAIRAHIETYQIEQKKGRHRGKRD